MNNFDQLKTDFKDWLTHPLTETFIKILQKQYNSHLEYANQESFRSYYKKELSDQATLAYGKADGMKTILDLMNACKDQETVDGLFGETFGGENE